MQHYATVYTNGILYYTILYYILISNAMQFNFKLFNKTLFSTVPYGANIYTVHTASHSVHEVTTTIKISSNFRMEYYLHLCNSVLQ